MRLYAGSYERFLFGFEMSPSDGGVSLGQVLSIPAHKSAVKCIDTAGSVVVTGGADDQLHLFNMRSNTDLGFLVNPVEGPVPCVAFVKSQESQKPKLLLSGTPIPSTVSMQQAVTLTILLHATANSLLVIESTCAGSSSGEICVWRAEGWEHVKAMSGHKDLVSDIRPHPSGKLALSVSRDKQMRLWDLNKGSCAYQAALGTHGDLVGFFEGGEMYYVSSSDPSSAKGSKLSLHSIQGDTVATITPNRKVLSVATAGEYNLVAGCDGGHLMSWDIRNPSTCIFSLDGAHKLRIRALTAPLGIPAEILNGAANASGIGSTCMASASSDGAVKLWSMETLRGGSTEPQPLGEINVGARFTCLCAFDEQRKKAKRPRQGKAEVDIIVKCREDAERVEEQPCPKKKAGSKRKKGAEN